MNRLPVTSVLVATVALAAAAARADDTSLDPARNEVSVFGGMSFLDARSAQLATVSLPAIPATPGYAGGPGFPGFPGGDVQLSTETKLGNGGLFGLRYAFYLRKQLALEADAAVVPGQDLRNNFGLCGPSGCLGPGGYPDPRYRGIGGMYGMYGQDRSSRYGPGYGYGYGDGHGHDLTAWHYGAGLTYDILGRDVRPFVLLGAGGVSYDGDLGTKTNFALRFGAGVKVYFGRLGARVDAIDYLVFDQFLSGRTEHDVHVTGGGFVRF